jgi:molecular chaperone IbpA
LAKKTSRLLGDKQMTTNIFPFIGFDEIFGGATQRAIEKVSTFPHTDIVKFGEGNGHYVVQMAIAGYSKDDITITHDKHVLTVTGKPNVGNFVKSKDGAIVVSGGLAIREFTKKLTVADSFNVDATVADGLLTITLTRDEPLPEIKRIEVK